MSATITTTALFNVIQRAAKLGYTVEFWHIEEQMPATRWRVSEVLKAEDGKEFYTMGGVVSDKCPSNEVEYQLVRAIDYAIGKLEHQKFIDEKTRLNSLEIDNS